MSRTNRSRTPASRGLRLIPGTPVVTVRGPQVPGVFSYSNNEWAMVVSANSWNSETDLHQLLFALEAAGQHYRASRHNLHSRSRRTLRQALIRDALQAWTIATDDTALKFSRVGKAPAGPLIRYLTAALRPILGVDMIGSEVLAQAICSVRPPRKSG